MSKNYEKTQGLRRHPRDEIIDDELLQEYRNLLDEDILRGIAALHNDMNLVDLKEE